MDSMIAMEMEICIGLLILVLSKQGDGALWSQTKDEYVKLHEAYVHTTNKAYYSDILPRADVSSPVDVTVALEMYAIREFDAAAAALEIVGSFSMTWNDPLETLSASTNFNSSTVKSLLVNYKKIWTPVIVLINSADYIQRIGDETYLARFNLTSGTVNWKPRALLRAVCTPNVKYFPFDEHECSFVFVPWYQDSTKVRLLVTNGEWGLDKYDDSGIWQMKSTSSSVSLVNGYYYATFTLIFSRQPLFFMINVVFPVLLLTILSGFLFLLPVASGERVGFGITCFLSFVVLLQTMVQFFPEISEPMSLLCVYAVIMMIFSGLLSIVNILLLKLYHSTSDSCPRPLMHFFEIIKCTKCKPANRHGDPGSTGSETSVLPGSVSSGSDCSEADKQIDWASLGKTLDTFFVLIFLCAQLGFTVVYLAPIFSQA